MGIVFCVWILTLSPLNSSSLLSLQYKAVILICCFNFPITVLFNNRFRFSSTFIISHPCRNFSRSEWKIRSCRHFFPFHFALQHLYDELLCCVFSLYISKWWNLECNLSNVLFIRLGKFHRQRCCYVYKYSSLRPTIGWSFKTTWISRTGTKMETGPAHDIWFRFASPYLPRPPAKR